MKRYALVKGLGVSADKVSAYLPAAYRVIWEGDYNEGVLTDHVVVIQGEDPKHGGFGLDSFIIPRLGSGMMFAVEVDLSHPVMKLIPEPRRKK